MLRALLFALLPATSAFGVASPLLAKPRATTPSMMVVAADAEVVTFTFDNDGNAKQLRDGNAMATRSLTGCVVPSKQATPGLKRAAAKGALRSVVKKVTAPLRGVMTK